MEIDFVFIVTDFVITVDGFKIWKFTFISFVVVEAVMVGDVVAFDSSIGVFVVDVAVFDFVVVRDVFA